MDSADLEPFERKITPCDPRPDDDRNRCRHPIGISASESDMPAVVLFDVAASGDSGGDGDGDGDGLPKPQPWYTLWFSRLQRAWQNRPSCSRPAFHRPRCRARRWKFSGRNVWMYRLKERLYGRGLSVRHLKEKLMSCRWCPQRSMYGGSLWFLGTHYSTISSSDDDDDDDDDDDGDANDDDDDGDHQYYRSHRQDRDQDHACYRKGLRRIEKNEDFEADFRSRIYITYRKGFDTIRSTKFTTDVGWGCMIRSCQMLLAQALICHHLGRAWRHFPSQPYSRTYLEILQYFGDSYSHNCPFSIHNILLHGAPYGLVPGSWLGPYAMCCSLQALAGLGKSPRRVIERTTPFAIHVVSGENHGERGGAPCLRIDAVTEICCRWGDCGEEWTGLLVLIPVVLGLKKVNPRYLPLLAETFSFPQSVGMIGGRPGASMYLVGVEGDRVFYLDPHHVQQVCIISPENSKVDTSTYHCSRIRHMSLSAIDPSLALGFYCRDKEDLSNFCDRASRLEMKANGAPLFNVVKGSEQNTSDSLFAELKNRDHNKPSSIELSSSDEDWEIL